MQLVTGSSFAKRCRVPALGLLLAAGLLHADGVLWAAASPPAGAASAGAAPAGAAPASAAPADTTPAASEQAIAPFSLAEARLIDAVRTRRAAGTPAQLVGAARAYLAQYPAGRYADEALLALGDGLAASKAGDEAAATYRRLIDEHPDSPLRDEARVGLLPLLQQAGKGEEAHALAERIAQSPTLQRSQARLWQARDLFGQGRTLEAAALLEGIQPGDDLSPAQQTESVRLLGMCYWKAGQQEPARRWFRQYLGRDDAPEAKAEVLMLLARDADSGGRVDEALANYQQVIDRYPVPAVLPEALYRRADLYAAQVRDEPPSDLTPVRLRQAIGYYSAYLETDHAQNRGTALHERARLLARVGRNEEALQDYERLVALGEPYRGDVDILREQVGVLRQLKRDDEAAALLGSASRSSTLEPQVRLALLMDQAVLQYERKNCAAVEGLLQPLPPISDPDSRRRALFMRGLCRYQQGKWEGASVDLEGFINHPEYEPLVLTPLLDSYEKSAQYPRLARTVEELLLAHRVEPNEALLLQMGRAYAHLGEPAKILDVYGRLEAMNPAAVNTAAVQMAIGGAYEAQGQVDPAIRHYQTVLTLAAGPPPAKEYLDALERLQPLYFRLERHAELVLLDRKAAALVKDSAGAARVKAWGDQAQVAWGQFLIQKGQRTEGIAHLEKARQATSPSDGSLRVDIIVALSQAYAAGGQPNEATRLVKAELKATRTSSQKARLVSALVATSADWGTRLAREGDLDGAIQYYVQALKQLGSSQPQERYAMAMRLDPLYAAKGNFAARVKLAEQLEGDRAFESMRGDLAAYRSEVLKSWGRFEARHNRYPSALEKYHQALAALSAKEWKRRYDVAGAIGQLATAHQDYAVIVPVYEQVLPDIADPALQAQVRQYVGRVDIEWAKQAQAKKDLKTARARYAHALDNLPEHPPADRVAAIQGLSAVLVESGKPEEAAKAMAAEARKLAAGEGRQAVDLLLGQLYRDVLKNPQQARTWLVQADTGNASGPSLEAGLALAELDVRSGDPGAAAQRLEHLAQRDIGESAWQVPIHYRLAVLYHRQQQLPQALAEYTAVAAAKSRDARTRYAKVIAESREQAQAISEYLKLTGGTPGSRIAVPKLKEVQ